MGTVGGINLTKLEDNMKSPTPRTDAMLLKLAHESVAHYAHRLLNAKTDSSVARWQRILNRAIAARDRYESELVSA